MSDSPRYATVYLDDEPFPVQHTTGYINLGQFQRKQTTGDYTRDSDEIMSSKIWTDLTGGLGVDTIREGADEGRSWFATIDGTRPFQWANWPAVLAVDTAEYPLGDMTFRRTTTMYLAPMPPISTPGTKRRDTIGASLDTFANPPVGRAVAFNGKLYVPLGVNGCTSGTARRARKSRAARPRPWRSASSITTTPSTPSAPTAS